jgi:hypothetical protein
MARKHYARSIVSRTNVQFDEWMEVLRNQHEGAVPKDVIHRTAKTVLRKCDPKQYLLSHATIVASVDCYAPKRAKTGRQMNRGVQTEVRWPDFRIKPECLDIVNNNGDAWERSLLLSTYRTFIGAPNYLEHIQLPELSKGFIVDAIARDLGKSCYIDILVATDRKHKTLVQDILSGKIGAMSMGCISLFTTCTKCGNVAGDDSQLCPCVQYDGKRSAFTDDDGISTIVAEIIGHVSIPNSNQFIEASWVRQPAFSGAQRRNFLNADESPAFAAQLRESNQVYEVRKLVPEMDGMKKAARYTFAEGQDQGGQPAPGGLDDDDDAGGDDAGGDDQGGGQSAPGGLDDDAGGDQGGDDDGGGSDDKPSAPQKPKLDEFVEKAQEMLLEMIVKGLGDKMAPKPEDVGSVSMPAAKPINKNENLVRSSEFNRRLRAEFGSNPALVRWASQAWRVVHVGGPDAIRRAGMKSRDLIILSWIEDRLKGRRYAASLYKLAMKIGPITSFPSETSFLAACSMRMGRSLDDSEREFLRWKGKISAIAQF